MKLENSDLHVRALEAPVKFNYSSEFQCDIAFVPAKVSRSQMVRWTPAQAPGPPRNMFFHHMLLMKCPSSAAGQASQETAGP
eukprot:1157965-Pelagomonas_calceolata.AAC.4